MKNSSVLMMCFVLATASVARAEDSQSPSQVLKNADSGAKNDELRSKIGGVSGAVALGSLFTYFKVEDAALRLPFKPTGKELTKLRLLKGVGGVLQATTAVTGLVSLAMGLGPSSPSDFCSDLDRSGKCSRATVKPASSGSAPEASAHQERSIASEAK